MCGIAGYIGTKNIGSSFYDVLESMKHRGPDGHGMYEHFRDGVYCYLFHTRLAIIDLDPRATQPMHYKGKHFVFNGELYNYKNLSHGFNLTTQSDSEVLFRLIDDSWDWLDKCEWMGAFALYDENTGVLSLCRDRFGEKPLYIYRASHGLYFASEVKTLRAMGCEIGIDPETVTNYLQNGYKAIFRGNPSFWKGVKVLPPATYLEIGQEENFTRYWTPVIDDIDTGSTYHELVDITRQRVIKAVERRLRADVPLAFAMSGGVDSLTIISIAKRIFNYDVHGFTILPHDERYNEQELVDYAIRELGIRHTYVYLDKNGFKENLRQLVRQHDAPVFTISYYIHWLLMRAVSNWGYKVISSGTGADELFSGYYDHFLMHLACCRAEDLSRARAYMNWDRHVKPFVRNPYLRNPFLFVQNPEFRDHIYEGHTEVKYTDDLLRNRMLNELFTESVPVILHEDDLNAMSFGIENRSPFLDRELMEHAYTIPTKLLIQNGYNKAVLRDAMRGIVPDAILDNRRKVGFNANISELTGMSPLIDNETSKERFRKKVCGMFRKEFGCDTARNA